MPEHPSMTEQFADLVPNTLDIFLGRDEGNMLRGVNAAAGDNTDLLVGDKGVANDIRQDPDRLFNFQFFATTNGLPPDLSNPLVVQAYLQFEAQQVLADQEEDRTSRGGGSGRSLFPQEAALLNERAISERFGRDLDRQTFQENQRESAFGRAVDRMRLMQATDQLLDARRESAMDAAIAALPFMVPEGTEFFPGEEPGGLGSQLDILLGGQPRPREMPTMELPLQEMVGAPMQAGPEEIDEALLGLMNAPAIAPPALV